MDNADAYGGLPGRSPGRGDANSANRDSLRTRSTLARTMTGWVARPAKVVLGWIVFHTRFYRLIWRNKAVVVVFHRVNDSYPSDPITVGSSDFDRFVRWFGHFFDVVPLSELLNRIRTGQRLSTSLTITFDDGYRGNATIAAPILERHGLRACFFVATSYIGSEFVPWWDRQNGIDTKWMSWDHVRSLRSRGHEIGSHTETHIDLGTATPEDARREISGGTRRLEEELGESSGLFAFPFGQRRNMSDENQSLLEHLGLRCSLSAHGGTVRQGDDPFRLKRVNISGWFISPYQFGFELVSGRLDHD
jgi:peptidoglycan/xylan/chitin deacetylase (PgdA/CDA1 family)